MFYKGDHNHDPKPQSSRRMSNAVRPYLSDQDGRYVTPGSDDKNVKQNAELRVTLEKLRADREEGCHDRWHFHEGAYVRTDGYGLFLLQRQLNGVLNW